MSEFQAKWQALSASKTAVEETERAETLAEYVRAHAITLQVTFTDPTSGEPVPVGELHRRAHTPRVHVKAYGKGEELELSWQPLTKESIYPLLFE